MEKLRLLLLLLGVGMIANAVAAPPQEPLTVTVQGDGTVTSEPAGITCPSDCNENYNKNTSITLTATANLNSSFLGWQSDCIGAQPTCVVKMAAPINVTAVFDTAAPTTTTTTFTSTTTTTTTTNTTVASTTTTTLPTGGTVLTDGNDNLVYVAAEPCRLADTRKTAIMAQGVARDFQVSGANLAGQGGDAGGCVHPRAGTGVEPLAASVYLVAVPTGGTGSGWLTAFPSDQNDPSPNSVATVNYAKGQVVGNTTNVTLCPGGCPPGGPLGLVSFNSAQHVVMDIQGYFYPAAGSCSADMVAAGSVCVDKYEASVWSTTTGGIQYGAIGDDYPCSNDGSDCGAAIYARSEVNKTPSTRITQYQASVACANVGKRLATTTEWQKAASGTPSGTGDGSTGCNSQSGNSVGVTGNAPSCVSNAGAFDMVGNVWEWSAEIETDTASNPEFTATDDMSGRALGEAYNNSSASTPSTKSVFILNGLIYGGSGMNAQNPQIGFRCAR